MDNGLFLEETMADEQWTKDEKNSETETTILSTLLNNKVTFIVIWMRFKVITLHYILTSK